MELLAKEDFQPEILLQHPQVNAQAKYFKQFISPDQQLQLFNNLYYWESWAQQNKRHTIWMVGSKHCTCPYSYGSWMVQPQVFPDWLRLLANDITTRLSLPDGYLNSCNINYYPDGKATLGWHSDDEPLFGTHGQDVFIFSLSVGASRDFSIGTKEMIPKYLANVYLKSGDAMTMEGRFQEYYKHKVEIGMLDSEPRFNLTWRHLRHHMPTCTKALKHPRFQKQEDEDQDNSGTGPGHSQGTPKRNSPPAGFGHGHLQSFGGGLTHPAEHLQEATQSSLATIKGTLYQSNQLNPPTVPPTSSAPLHSVGTNYPVEHTQGKNWKHKSKSGDFHFLPMILGSKNIIQKFSIIPNMILNKKLAELKMTALPFLLPVLLPCQHMLNSTFLTPKYITHMQQCFSQKPIKKTVNKSADYLAEMEIEFIKIPPHCLPSGSTHGGEAVSIHSHINSMKMDDGFLEQIAQKSGHRLSFAAAYVNLKHTTIILASVYL